LSGIDSCPTGLYPVLQDDFPDKLPFEKPSYTTSQSINLLKTKAYSNLSDCDHMLACFLLFIREEKYHFRNVREGSPMDMIFYSPAGGKAEERLGAMIEKLIPGVMTKTCRTIDALSNRLLQPPHNDLTIAVLLTADKADLFNLSSISEQFHDARIIVVAPDQDKDTVALAHRLRPRLLTYTDSDFAEVFAVLNNIMSEHHGLNNFHNMHT
jgi:hypothetical protein